MQIPKVLTGLRLPIIAAPMFTVSYPELVIAQCCAGIVGSFPALNARPPELLDEWLTDIQSTITTFKAANPKKKVGPIAVNQIIHQSNQRLEQDVRVCVKHQVPIFITSLRAPVKEIIDEVHRYGGIVLHDVINLRHAEKALEAGVDGLILVAAGAGGHAGTTSPFALVNEIRQIFKGPLALSGSISTGADVLAAKVMGVDFAYMGTRFIASQEAHAAMSYKDAIVRAKSADIVYTDYFTGVSGNYLQESILEAGLDPKKLPNRESKTIAESLEQKSDQSAKAWKDIWGAGQGVGSIMDVPSTEMIVARLEQEYQKAIHSICQTI
ncbi:NAD(P)H-dependent flavin oxidoreductase [Polynucleobacter kasalickyi]|uniref:Nitronate monooxygenase n=1 Tax=Polynucleobacter kasalickyi TaxID=1938817 RepID=A0A1W2BB20_9BURK|nr:nitronate monooxygenase family protein [Polynucleobacter kasalickyi]SMC70109.1 nitronate monooxygenase [Polynucleobacter kasalickyi]